MEHIGSQLVQEIQYYEEIKPSLLPEHKGRFVVIKGRAVLGIFATDDEGYEAGLAAFGYVPMLVHEITEQEPVLMMFYITSF